MGNFMVGGFYPPKMYIGTTLIQKILCGSTKVWPKDLDDFYTVHVHFSTATTFESHDIRISKTGEFVEVWDGASARKENNQWIIDYSFAPELADQLWTNFLYGYGDISVPRATKGSATSIRLYAEELVENMKNDGKTEIVYHIYYENTLRRCLDLTIVTDNGEEQRTIKGRIYYDDLSDTFDDPNVTVFENEGMFIIDQLTPDYRPGTTKKTYEYPSDYFSPLDHDYAPDEKYNGAIAALYIEDLFGTELDPTEHEIHLKYDKAYNYILYVKHDENEVVKSSRKIFIPLSQSDAYGLYYDMPTNSWYFGPDLEAQIHDDESIWTQYMLNRAYVANTVDGVYEANRHKPGYESVIVIDEGAIKQGYGCLGELHAIYGPEEYIGIQGEPYYGGRSHGYGSISVSNIDFNKTPNTFYSIYHHYCKVTSATECRIYPNGYYEKPSYYSTSAQIRAYGVDRVTGGWKISADGSYAYITKEDFYALAASGATSVGTIYYKEFEYDNQPYPIYLEATLYDGLVACNYDSYEMQIYPDGTVKSSNPVNSTMSGNNVVITLPKKPLCYTFTNVSYDSSYYDDNIIYTASSEGYPQIILKPGAFTRVPLKDSYGWVFFNYETPIISKTMKFTFQTGDPTTPGDVVNEYNVIMYENGSISSIVDTSGSVVGNTLVFEIKDTTYDISTAISSDPDITIMLLPEGIRLMMTVDHFKQLSASNITFYVD